MPVVKATFQPALVALAQVLEAFFESDLQADQRIAARPRLARRLVLMAAQQILGHGRHERAREQIGGQHREHHRLGQRHEQIARHAPSERTWARTRCRWRASKQMPEPRSAGRRPEWPARSLCPCARLRLMFSISTVASSTRMPTASASPPRVMMLMVSPSALSTMSEVRIESGIETAMISVLRQLPRKDQDHQPGQAGGNRRFANHAIDRRAHKNRLVGQRLDVEFRRQAGHDLRQQWP